MPVDAADSPGAVSDRVGARAPLVFALIVLLGFGLLYSLVGTGLGRMLFPMQAGGSVIERDGMAVGSALIAQPFTDARYFQPRPSAAGYDARAASGSNLARSNPALAERIAGARAAVALRDGVAEADVVPDLLTQSGGGLDPHLSPAGARQQIARVARARGLREDEVLALVEAHTETEQFGVFGAARVNVLHLNLALDARSR
ncbi:potassium-transporting ATPase subunit KdpC [Chiayiivirga flava]|uniref:Potassium-transporting ATPase KdpC subunit n=1 Tax=Chiayiivirga flava TaxID=659595 RepID=A0A7W8D863_9GAMM|nr:K+-transporting ATPase ATPase C chain [Chiayiivirga flava]